MSTRIYSHLRRLTTVPLAVTTYIQIHITKPHWIKEMMISCKFHLPTMVRVRNSAWIGEKKSDRQKKHVVRGERNRTHLTMWLSSFVDIQNRASGALKRRGLKRSLLSSSNAKSQQYQNNTLNEDFLVFFSLCVFFFTLLTLPSHPVFV